MIIVLYTVKVLIPNNLWYSHLRHVDQTYNQYITISLSVLSINIMLNYGISYCNLSNANT